MSARPGCRWWRGISLERTARPWRLAAQIAAVRRALRELRDRRGPRAPDPRPLAGGAGATRDARARLVRTVHHRRAVHAGAGRTRWLLGRTDALIAVQRGDRRPARAAGAPGPRVPSCRARSTRALHAGRGRRRRAGELGLGDAPVAGCVARMVPGRGHDMLLRAAARLRERLPERPRGAGGARRGPARPRGALGESWGSGHRRVRGLSGRRPAGGPGRARLRGAPGRRDPRSPAGPSSRRWPRDARSWRRGSAPSRRSWSNGETGWLVEPAPEAVAAALEAALRDRGRAASMGAAGRRRVEAHFTPSRRAALVEALYAGVLAKEALPRR